jgi:hypothetical protein
MRNVLKNTMFAILAFIALSLTSCTDNGDDKGSSADPNAIEKTSVSFNVTTPKPVSTGRSVVRGTIDTKVSAITIKAVKVWTPGSNLPGFPNYNVQGTFELVPNGTVGALPGFDLQDVAIGTNNFYATTEAAGTPTFKVDLDNHPWTTNAAEAIFANNKLNTYKAAIPFATYTGEVLNKVIYKPEASNNIGNNVAFNMTTQNGRITSAITLDDYLVQLEYRLKVIIDVYTPSGVLIERLSPSTQMVGGDVMLFQWSNAHSVAGAKVKYTVEIKELGQLQSLSAPLYTYSFEDVVVASASKNTHYTIGRDKAQVTLNGTDDFTFNIPEWIEGNNTVGTN